MSRRRSSTVPSRAVELARSAARLLLALALALPVAGIAAPAVAAAEVTLGEPRVASEYGQFIDFSVDLTAVTQVERLELQLLFPGALGPHRVDVPVPPAGTSTARYRLDLTGGGNLVPNTAFTATWAAYPGGGAAPVTSREQTVRYEDTTHEWHTVSGDLVTVRWYEGDRAFGDRALRIAERAVEETADLLGVTVREPFDFIIYADDASFRQALGPSAREWVAGTSHDEIRTLFALIRPDQIADPWVDIVVPHEIVHLVFSTMSNNPFRSPPLWLHEGLATYLSEGYTESDRSVVEHAARAGDLIPFSALTSRLPTDAERAGIAYAETASAIDYLVRAKGDRALIDLVSSYAEGLTDDEAFTRAVGTDLAGFQAEWLAELGAQAPERYGPQPAPPGPLPPGWSGPAPTPAAGPTGNAAFTPAPPASALDNGLATAAASPAAPDPGETAAGDVAVALAPLLVIAGLVVVVVVGLIIVRRREPGA